MGWVSGELMAGRSASAAHVACSAPCVPPHTRGTAHTPSTHARHCAHARSRTAAQRSTRLDVRELLPERLDLLSQHAHSDCHGVLTLCHFCVLSVVAIKAQGLVAAATCCARARARGGGVGCRGGEGCCVTNHSLG